MRDELLAAAGADHRLFIRTNRTLRAEVLRIFDATFAITYALQAIAIVVAILGVAATLLTLCSSGGASSRCCGWSGPAAR